MTRATAKPSLREAKRLETRQRVLDAAITEFKRAGMADADVGAIIRSAGVAHGTFYFHFPTKEHVLFELERQAEETAGRELATFRDDLLIGVTAFFRDMELVAALEQQRVGQRAPAPLVDGQAAAREVETAPRPAAESRAESRRAKS